MSYAITRAALADLKDIARYTRKTWGREQEKIYIKGIYDCFDKIVGKETFNSDVSYLKAGCFKCKVNHHFVIFRWIEEGRPEIIRVLHEEMDIPVQLIKSV